MYALKYQLNLANDVPVYTEKTVRWGAVLFDNVHDVVLVVTFFDYEVAAGLMSSIECCTLNSKFPKFLEIIFFLWSSIIYPSSPKKLFQYNVKQLRKLSNGLSAIPRCQVQN